MINKILIFNYTDWNQIVASLIEGLKLNKDLELFSTTETNYAADISIKTKHRYFPFGNVGGVKYEEDKDDNELPTIELKSLINKNLLTKYEQLVHQTDTVPCGKQIKTVDEFTINSWLNRLVIERLERKSEEIHETLTLNKNNW